MSYGERDPWYAYRSGLQTKLSDFHWHEAMDRASILADMIDTHLLSHPAVQSDPEILGKIDAAATALAGVYQLIGLRRCFQKDK